MFKRLAILAIALPFVSVSVAGPPKVTDLLPEPFQLVLSATWEASSGYNAVSDTYVIDEEKTARLEYVTCRAQHSMMTSNNVNFKLSVDIVDGAFSEVVILAGDMELLEKNTPGPTSYEGSFDLISACIGKHCNSLGDGKYVSLTLDADRDAPGDGAQSVDCVISGVIY